MCALSNVCGLQTFFLCACLRVWQKVKACLLLYQILFKLYELPISILVFYLALMVRFWWYKSWAVIFSMCWEICFLVTRAGVFLSVCARAVEIYFSCACSRECILFTSCVYSFAKFSYIFASYGLILEDPIRPETPLTGDISYEA